MIGFWKSVLSCCLRFHIFPAIPAGFLAAGSVGTPIAGASSTGLLGAGATGFGSGLASSIPNAISGIFGGGSSASKSNLAEVHKMGLAQSMGDQPTFQEKAMTSSPLMEPLNVTAKKVGKLTEKNWQEKALDFGLGLAEKSTTRLMEHMTDRAVSGLFDKSAKQRAMDDWKYDRIRFPGVTPWEIAGGSPGGSGQGGASPAQIGAGASRTAAGISAGAHTDAAEISSSPHVESVKFKTMPEVEKLLSEARLNDQERLNKAEELPHITPLREIEKAWKHAETMKNQTQLKQIKAQATLIRTQILTELQRKDLTKFDKQVREAYAKILRVPRTYQWAADAAFATGVLSGAGLLSGGLISRLRNLLPRGNKNPKGSPPIGGNKSGIDWKAWRRNTRDNFKNSPRGNKPYWME